jgi:Lon protease-like protein
MTSDVARIQLFPLALVLLPDENLGLHIFEERYKRMIARCRKDDSPFGIVLRVDDGLAAIGCTARLAEVIEEFPDGRMNIAVRGERPFRLLEVEIPEDPDVEPLWAQVEFMEDSDEEYGEAAEVVADLVARLRRAQAEIEGLAEALPLETPDARLSSFEWAVGLDIDVILKQRLLESAGERARLGLLLGHLEMLVVRTEVLAERKDAIRGNGKGD